MTKFEDEIILTPVISGITVSVISSVVTAPSVGMAVVSIVPGFGAGIGISISGSFDNMLRFWLLFFGRSLPPVSVRVSVVSIVPRFGAGISIGGGSSSGSGCSFGITFPVSVGVSVISTPSVVSTVSRISIVSIVIGLWAGFGLRLCHDSGSSESYEQQQLHFG